MKNGLVIFGNRIYVSNNNELKKFILRDFHVKLYSIHLRYHNTVIIVKKLYHWLNMKKSVVEFVMNLHCQELKVNCKHLGGLLQLILIQE